MMNDSSKNHPSFLTRITVLTCIALVPLLWRHRSDIRKQFTAPTKTPQWRQVSSLDALTGDESVTDSSVEVSTVSFTDLKTEWTPSPVKNVSYADKFMVRVEEQHAQRRELQDVLVQESRAWRIGDDPQFEYEDSQFTMKWEVSDFIPDRYATFTVYDGHGCKEGDARDITEEINAFYAAEQGNSAYLQNFGLQPDPSTPYNPASLGEGTRFMRMYMEVQPTAANAPIFHYTDENNQQKARIDFCIRFSLYTDDISSSNAQEVNFQETLVTFFADLTDGFQLGDVVVENKDRLERNARIECEIIAYECDRQNNRLEGPRYVRNQGREVRVCVELSEESKKEGLLLDRIHWFYWILENEFQTVRQNAIVFDSVQSPDTLTEYECLRGAELCPFNTLLYAKFYQWANVINTVKGIGEGVCRLGARSLIAEDVPRNIGSDIIGWMVMDEGPTPLVKNLTFTDVPPGVTVSYTDTDGTAVTEIVPSEGYNFTIGRPEDNEDAIRAALDTLTLLAPLHSDEDFVINYYVGTASGYVHNYVHPVTVLAIADSPQVTATESLQVEENSEPVELQITAVKSEDVDNSESLSVEITVFVDAFGPIGSISAPLLPAGVQFTDARGGKYQITAEGSSPDERESQLNSLLSNGLYFQPRPYFSGVYEEALRIDAVSTEQSDGVAPIDSEEWGTLGDKDTKTERATTYTAVSIAPVNQIPYLQNDQSYVVENKMDSNNDLELDVAIGRSMGMTVDDKDGSQYLDVIITGFPTNVIDMYFLEQLGTVAAAIDKARGTVTIAGKNSTQVLAVLDTLVVVLAHDDDRNFRLTIEGTSKDSNGVIEVVDTYSLSHTVIVGAVADTPTLDRGAGVKQLAVEGSSGAVYSVQIRLNDQDGSETFQGNSVDFEVSFPIDVANGQPPVVGFERQEGVTVTTHGPPHAQHFTLTGTTADLTAAMNTLKITPGAHNGEDISVVVTVTAQESNPSETGDGEIAVEKVEVIDSFTIPVDPKVEGEPVIILPEGSINGNEDTKIDLGIFEVQLDGIEDPDGSEVYFVEVDTESFSSNQFENTRFWVDNTEIAWQNYVLNGWLRFPNSTSSLLSIRGPGHFSGVLPLTLRGTIVDFSMSGQATKSTDPQTINVNVFPVADRVNEPPTDYTVGVEDNGPIPFGTTLAGTRIRDNGNTRRGNNPETETFSKVIIKVPANSASVIYKVAAGPFLPASYQEVQGIYSGVGTAQISYDPNDQIFDITSSIITDTADIGSLSLADRKIASDDITRTLSAFEVTIGPEHTDENGHIDVVFTTLDVNLGIYSELDSAFRHDLVVLAVADKASIITHATVAVDEDSASIPFRFNVTNSDDQDGSEFLSVRITVPKENGLIIGIVSGNPPTGVTMTKESQDKYLIEAEGSSWTDRQAKLNAFGESGDLAFTPRVNWAGSAQLQVDVISTETAVDAEIASGAFGGPDYDSKTETTTAYIDVIVKPVADAPIVTHVKGNAMGFEDSPIEIAVSVTLSDQDGSEIYVMEVSGSSLPPGCTILGAGSREILPLSGVYTLDPADVDEFHLIPPLHYSTAHQPIINVATKTIVTDGPSSTYTIEFTIPVKVIGVSDKPSSRNIQVNATEDEEYPLGQAIAQQLDGVLVDNDGSETLYLVLGGLDKKKLSGIDESAMLYLGNGEWAIDASAVGSLMIVPVPHYSGEEPFPALTLRAVSQEVDGNQSSSDFWSIAIDVFPLADGFKEWTPAVTVTERENEIDNLGVSLAGAGNGVLIDNDGSETVMYYRFDFTSLIANAKISEQLKVLTNNNEAGINELVANFVFGKFSFDGSVLTVLANDIAGVKIDGQLFKDSNEGFEIPVEAFVEDAAMIDNTKTTNSKTETTRFKVVLEGTADIPTVYSDDTITGCRKIQFDMGGDTTDADVTLGRQQSESIFYLVSSIDMSLLPGYRFVDSNHRTVGFDAGAKTWILPRGEVVAAQASGGLFFYTQDRPAGARRALQESNSTSSPTQAPTVSPALFKLWSVAQENDGDEAFVTKEFSVEFWRGECGGVGSEDPPEPLAPILTIGGNVGLEDEKLSLEVSAEVNQEDDTNPIISIIVSNLPEGFSISGKQAPGFYFNYETGTYSALASYFAAGNVEISPPKDFAGTASLTLEAIAVNSWFLSSSSGQQSLDMYFDPVADGVGISIPDLSGGMENQPVRLPITLSAIDTDGSEEVGATSYVKVCPQATLMPSYELVQSGDVDAFIGDKDLEGYYRIPSTELNGLSMQPQDYWHGPCPVFVVAVSVEKEDDQDGDHMVASEATFNPYIISVPTPPNVAAPESTSGVEDAAIFLPGLSASLVDTIDDNGHEQLSTVIRNVPVDSILSHGSNSGEGRWAIPTDMLDSIYITPPPHYAGSFTLKFEAIAYDIATGTEAVTSSDIQVQVEPVADMFYILAKNVELMQGDTNVMFLTIRMEDVRGDSEGEVPPETIHLYFDAVPPGVTFESPAGGLLSEDGGLWTFEGTQDQANSLTITTTAETPIKSHNITVIGYTVDGASTLTPIRDDFLLKVVDPNDKTSRVLEHSEVTYNFQRVLYGCGDETIVQWESSPGLFNLVQHPVMIDSQGNNSVTYTLDSTMLNPSVSNWVAIMYPSAPLGQTVCETVARDNAPTYEGNCYGGGTTAYLFLNVPDAPSGTESVYLPTACSGLYGKPNAKTIMVELSIPCASCDADNDFGDNFLSVNNDSFDDDAFDDDALYDDDSYGDVEISAFEMTGASRRHLESSQGKSELVVLNGMTVPSMDADTRQLLMISKNPKYRFLQEQQVEGGLLATSDISIILEIGPPPDVTTTSSSPSARSMWMMAVLGLSIFLL